jgi:hypothetical protein
MNSLTIINIILLAPLFSGVDAQAAKVPVTCNAESPECCWVKRSLQQMGRTSAVSATSATACCRYLGSNTQASGIPGVYCTSTGKVTVINWTSKGLKGAIPFGSLVNLPNLKKL